MKNDIKNFNNFILEKNKTKGEKYKGKHIPSKYLTRKPKEMKKEIDEFRGKDKYKTEWEADFDKRTNKRIDTKKSDATKAYQKKYGKKMEHLKNFSNFDKNMFLTETKGSVDTKGSKSNDAIRKKSKDSGISMTILKDVYKRGMAAWNSGHRPGVSQQQWALGRVNSFITGVGGSRKSDSDLWKKAKEQKKKKNENIDYENKVKNYMFFFNLKTMLRIIDDILKNDEIEIDDLLMDGHNWAEDHISSAKESLEHVYNYLMNRLNENNELNNYMFFSNLKNMKKLINDLIKLDKNKVDNILFEHDWIEDHISKSKENIEQVYHFILSSINEFDKKDKWINDETETKVLELFLNENKLSNVEKIDGGIKYRGEKFPGFNKPKTYRGKGKFKKRVLAKEGDNIKVLNYGHKDYSDFTKHKDTDRRKNFRARHKCDPVSNLSKLTKRYWACQDLW